MNYREQAKKLEAIIDEFNEFDGLEATKENKIALTSLIRKYTDQGATRKDDKVDKTVDLWIGRDNGMAADFTIGSTNDGKIWICNDCIWRSVAGLYEAEQEAQVYERKYR